MKKHVLIVAILFLFVPFIANGNEDWVIESFESDIIIQPDGKVQIEETIQVDFGDSQKHGIFRDIPYVYESPTGDEIYTEINIQNVLINETDVPYEVDQNSANIRVKIGDPDVTITGEQTYSITYEAVGVLMPFEEYDEIYWNVTGHDWEVPINNVEAKVTLPEGVIRQSSCYQGLHGSTSECETSLINDKTVTFRATDNLSSQEGLTVAVGFSKGIVPILNVTAPETIEDTIFQWPTIGSFLLILIIGNIYLIWHWWKNGRDAWYLRKSLHDSNVKEQTMPLRAYEPIVVEYDPPENLRPAEIGTLIDEKANTLDVSATIVDLAVRGYLVIDEVPKTWVLGSKDYTFKRTDKVVSGLMKYEELLLESLFKEGSEVKLSSLKDSFYKDLSKIKKEIYKEVTSKKLFVSNPHHTRMKYIGLAVGVTFFGFFVAILGGSFLQGILLGVGVAIGIIGIEMMIYSNAMPRRTAHGRELLRKVRGYEVFLSGTEKYRQPFFEKENIFMEVLPYTIVFGVTKKLAKAFEEMGIEPSQPYWYHSSVPFSALAFSQDMESFSKTLSSSLASSPNSSGSGGSGFSGGGFGGGGGGSW